MGADLEGGRSITDLIQRAAGDDTLLYLPHGRYHVDNAIEFYEFSNFGIIGDNATIVPPEGYADNLFNIGHPGTARGFVFDGITFDFRAEYTGGRPLLVKVEDGLIVRDVTVVGVQDVNEQMMRFDVTSESGAGLIERMRLPDGSTPGTGSTGCYVGETNRGDLTFFNCHIAGFHDNGIYAEPPAGTMRVIGGLFENNNVSSVRVGGGDAGLVKGVHVRCDASPEGFTNMRGIRLREGTGSVIENSLVELLDVTGSDGAITLASQMNEATVRNTRIRIDADDVVAVLAKPPETNDGGASLRCENVCVEGTAANTAAVLVENRDGCLFDGLSIHQTGDERDGVELIGSDESVLRNSRISVTGEPVVVVDSELETQNVWTNDDPENSTIQCGSV